MPKKLKLEDIIKEQEKEELLQTITMIVDNLGQLSTYPHLSQSSLPISIFTITIQIHDRESG